MRILIVALTIFTCSYNLVIKAETVSVANEPAGFERVAIHFLKIEEHFKEFQLVKCRNKGSFDFEYKEDVKTPHDEGLTIAKGTKIKIKCTPDNWEVQFFSDFKWKEFEFSANSLIRSDRKESGGVSLYVVPNKEQIKIGKETLQSESKIFSEDVWRLRAFKEQHASGEAKKIEVLESSLQTGLTRVKVVERLETLCPYTVGSELYYSDNQFVKAAISAETTCGGLKIPKGSTVWDIMNSTIVKISTDIIFGDSKIPSGSYLIESSGGWNRVYLSSSIEHKGKKIPGGELISTDFISGREQFGGPRLISILPADMTSKEKEQYLRNQASYFNVYPTNIDGISISNGTMTVVKNEKNQEATSEGELILLGGKSGKYSFLSDRYKTCPEKVGNGIKCQHYSVYTILSSEKEYWGIASVMNGPPNITSIEDIEFKATDPKSDSMNGEIICSPREEEAEAIASVNVDFRTKNVKVSYGCDNNRAKSFEEKYESFEEFQELKRIKSPSASIYFRSGKLYSITKDKRLNPFKRLLVNDSIPVYIEDIGERGKYLIIPFTKYLDEDDTGC